jgi:hypothetical protein
MIAMHTTDGLPYFIVGGCSDSTGVENDQARVGSGGGGEEALRGEAGLDGGSIGLRGSASEVFYPKSIHCCYDNRLVNCLVLSGYSNVCPHADAWRFGVEPVGNPQA